MKNVYLFGILVSLACILSLIPLASSAGFLPINKTEYWLHNEAAPAPFAAYDMLNASINNTASVTATISAGFPGYRCWANSWIAQNFSSNILVNGTWNFSIAYSCSNGAINANASAVIFHLNSTGRYNITGATTTSVAMCRGTTALQVIGWNYNLASGVLTNLSAGERIGIQLCGNVNGGTGGGRTITLRWEHTNTTVEYPYQLYDVDAPTLNLSSPQNISYNNATILINFSASETGLDGDIVSSQWFYNGTGNTTYTSAIYQTVSQGNNTFVFYANDSVNNVNSTNVTFFVDSIFPLIVNGTGTERDYSNFSRNSIYVNVSVIEANPKNITYLLFNATSRVNLTIFSMANQTSNVSLNWTNLINGNYSYNVTVCDILGNCNTTVTRHITLDTKAPNISVYSPQNITYNTTQILINFSASDALMGVQSKWFYNGTGNTTYTIPVYVNASFGSNTFVFYANDTVNNVNSTNLTFYVNAIPMLGGILAYPNPIKGGNSITINSSGVSDANNNTLSFYCSEIAIPNATNTICTGGNTVSSVPYNLTCTYTTILDNLNHSVNCRIYDGSDYSNVSNSSYVADSLQPTTSIVSVAGSLGPSYFDTVNDGRTDVIVSGEANMVCRWSSSDLAYSAMSNPCVVSGTNANCSVNDVVSQGAFTRYVACADSLGNGQNSSQNLDVSFYLDYTAPTTFDNATTGLHVPNYTVTITPQDNIDGSPVTYYCTSQTAGCNPVTSIGAGQIVYNSSYRGINYLRYYSIDFAGNSPGIVNRTINITRLPVLSSASDNAIVIKGGRAVNVSTVSSEPDGISMNLFVCNQSGASFLGCTFGTYCNATGLANISCNFSSEADSNTHNWYAYIFSSLNESATNNPLTGSYTTDLIPPSIIVNNPLNNSNTTQTAITLSITTNESGGYAWYALDNLTNVSMSNSTAFDWTSVLSGLTIGQYNLTFYANDSYGNIGRSTINFSVTPVLDTTPPAIIILNPTNASFQPASVLINVTADENLSWAGYQLNNGAIVSLGNSSLTVWYVTLGLTEESSYNLTIYANDTSHNRNNKSIMFYTDSLVPRYSNVAASPSSANISQAVNCSITWNDGFNISNVILGENVFGTFENHTITFSGTNGIASYTIVGAKLTSIGTYTCNFYATDAAGNTNATSTTFTVNDVTAPIITVTSPSNATYNQNSILAAISSNENLAWAGYSLDGSVNVSMLNISLTSWNATLVGLADGGHNIIFYANDSSNNLANSSRIFFGVLIGGSDTIPPVITVDTISNGTFYTTLTLDLNISTNENTTSAYYTLNSGAQTALSNSSLTKWNATLVGLASESTNNLQVYANDTSQNKGNTNLTFYVDSVAPRFLNVTAIPDTANESQSVVCNAYINDTFGLASVKIEEDSSGVFVNHTIDLFSAGWANYTLTNLVKGTYTCNFYATDAAGNFNSSDTGFTVNDVTAPVININSPINQTYSVLSILLSISLNENASSALYSLDGGLNNLSLDGSGLYWSKTVTFTNGNKTVTYFAIDSSGNIGMKNITFSIDTSLNDFILPVITIWSPVNNSYLLSSEVLLNITSDKSLSWAGYKDNGGSLTDLGNVSLTSWNATTTLTEGQHNLTFYANDSSTNKNQGTKDSSFYVDLTNPSIDEFYCTNPVNQSKNVSCNANLSDTTRLNYAIISHNATGTWQNSSQISLSGNSSNITYLITSGNLTPPLFSVSIYVYDLSGRLNQTTYNVTVNDDSFPEIYNITYYPNDTTELDPGVRVDVNATIVENYNLSSVVLMYKESSGSWNSILMTNSSALVVGLSNIVYNASFVPENGTWQFKINATDMSGNENISSLITLDVENDTTANITTSIFDVKSITLSQESENNSLGNLQLNNTGDNILNFTILVSSSISSRFSINATKNLTMAYVVNPKDNLTLSMEVNSTSLPTGIYNYSIIISSDAGTKTLTKQLNIQSAEGPYFSVTIDTYSANVTRGQEGIVLSSSLKNLGTQDASGVILSWTLPSEFTITSGSQNKTIGALPIGVSATNDIIISVSGSASDAIRSITASATSTEGVNGSASKQITIGSPVEAGATTVTVGGGAGGGSSLGLSGGGEAIEFSKTIEIVRGQQDGFDIEVYNRYNQGTLKDLTLDLTGFLSQYISISPKMISELAYDKTGKFRVTVKTPVYSSYEEYELKATIKGTLSRAGFSGSYSEVQNIKLIIQEISRDEAQSALDSAQEVVNKMRDEGYNTDNIERLFEQAKLKLSERHNKESYDLSQSIILESQIALNARNLLLAVKEALENPKKTGLVIGTQESQNQSLFFSGSASFSSKPTETLYNLAVAAFERGDYATAFSRAKESQTMLILERKGNLGLFLYLYWQFLIIGLFVVLIMGVFGYNKYKKVSIVRRIKSLNNEEDNIGNLMQQSQKDYYSGKISEGLYHSAMNQHNARLTLIKKNRTSLRNRRIKMFKSEEVIKNLDLEKGQIEMEAKKIQDDFYNHKKITEAEYKLRFEMINQRLAEIEDERTTLMLVRGGK